MLSAESKSDILCSRWSVGVATEIAVMFPEDAIKQARVYLRFRARKDPLLGIPRAGNCMNAIFEGLRRKELLQTSNLSE